MSTFHRTIRIIERDALAKVAERQNYWIRIVRNAANEDSIYAIAAVRCEDRREVHWLSTGRSTPAEAAKLMYSGFDLPPGATHSAYEVINRLLETGRAEFVIDAKKAA